MKKLGYKRAFWIPLGITELLITANWFRDPYAYVGDTPKFVTPIWFDWGIGLIAGSLLGGLSILIYHLLNKNKIRESRDRFELEATQSKNNKETEQVGDGDAEEAV